MMALVVLGVALLSACDNFTDYTVANQSDQDLVSWLAFAGCDKAFDPDTKILPKDDVPAHTRRELGTSFSPSTDPPRCVIVATRAGNAVLVEPYNYGAAYTVDEPINSGDQLPPNQGLDYSDSTWSRVKNGSIGTIVFLVIFLGIGVAFVGGILAGVYMGIQSTRKYRSRRP